MNEVILMVFAFTNDPPQTVNLNIVFEDETLVKKNPIIQECINGMMLYSSEQATGTVSFSEKQMENFVGLLQKKIGTRESSRIMRDQHASINEAKYAMLCLKKVLETQPVRASRRHTEKIFNIEYLEKFTKRSTIQHTGQINLDEDEMQFTFWLLDTDGLDFLSGSKHDVQLGSDEDLCLLNRAKSVTVNPLKCFFNIRSRVHSDLAGKERRLYLNQHGFSFQSRTQFEAMSDYFGAERGWQHERIQRIQTLGTDHFVLFLHPNLEITQYETDGEVSSRFRDELIDHLVEERSILRRGIRMSALFSQPALEWENAPQRIGLTPYFSHRKNLQSESEFGRIIGKFTQNDHVNLSKRIDKPMFSRFFELDINNNVMKDYLANNNLPETHFESLQSEWTDSVLQSAVYLGKIKRSGKKELLLKSPIRRILSDEAINSKLALFKYTVFLNQTSDHQHDQMNNSAAPIARRHMAWSRPNRCNGRTNILINDLEPSRRERARLLFGNGYNGYKPCERVVKSATRCMHHSQSGPRVYIPPTFLGG